VLRWRDHAHGFHAAGNHSRHLVDYDALRGEACGLKAGAAGAGNGHSAGRKRNASDQTRMPRDIVAAVAFGYGAAEDYVIDLGRINPSPGDGMPDRMAAPLWVPRKAFARGVRAVETTTASVMEKSLIYPMLWSFGRDRTEERIP